MSAASQARVERNVNVNMATPCKVTACLVQVKHYQVSCCFVSRGWGGGGGVGWNSSGSYYHSSIVYFASCDFIFFTVYCTKA